METRLRCDGSTTTSAPRLSYFDTRRVGGPRRRPNIPACTLPRFSPSSFGHCTDLNFSFLSGPICQMNLSTVIYAFFVDCKSFGERRHFTFCRHRPSPPRIFRSYDNYNLKIFIHGLNVVNFVEFTDECTKRNPFYF